MMVAELLIGNAMAAGKRAETLIKAMPAMEQPAIMIPRVSAFRSKTDRTMLRMVNSIDDGTAPAICMRLPENKMRNTSVMNLASSSVVHGGGDMPSLHAAPPLHVSCTGMIRCGFRRMIQSSSSAVNPISRNAGRVWVNICR